MRTTNEVSKKNVGASSARPQHRRLDQEKGITLIALIITIIVMLILVAVTISMAINGGLFDYAGKAVSDTQNAINLEQQLASGKIKIGDKWYASIDDYINNNPIQTGIEVTPTEIILKKKEEGAEGTEVLTGTLTASVFGMESEPEITWEKSSDAITLSATTGKTVTVEAVGTENAEVTVTAKCTYDGQEYTAESKITLEIIEKEEPKITVSEMQGSNLASYLGQTVNYGVTYEDASVNSYGGRKWEIFYADEEHIYLITKGHLAKGALSLTDKDGVAYGGTSDFTAENLQSKYPAVEQGLLNKTYNPAAAGTEADPYLKYSSENNNMKATQYLLDSRNWSTYVNEYADWAIGGPTQEIFVNSYNASNLSNTDVTLDAPSGFGYDTPLGNSGSVPQGSYLNHYTSTNNSPSYYWLACPSINNLNNLRTVNGTVPYVDYYTYNTKIAFRPLVCLDSNVKLTLNETTGEYDLSWNSAQN